MTELRGLNASKGVASGPVCIVLTLEDFNRVQPGDVLVTVHTNPDMLPVMRRAVAIVTDIGGKLSHAAIVSREFGIPCVTATRLATSTLKNGMRVCVDGTSGIVTWE